MGSGGGPGLGSLGAQLGGVVLALVLVLLLAWVVLKLLQRVTQGSGRGPGSASPLRLERVLSLGGRERLVLVRHGEVQLLLGVTSSSVTLLDRAPCSDGPATPDVATRPGH